ncbi:MAG: bifunctional UDP-N-acetylglucosamine diphosphorylase/glucosamine-1-phosphate N-acetyltransferase GlmU [Hoeflea sp.]|uniref:bifunctional UDP-N-acetylglucosamine diphosphorylase/glucosamine-1-phosphate N-acetyltransferase GlmU n=1 Tax=Hoeflea sp. TaxID=1940281 RepID=UPI001D42B2DC|nr:bifunctional UDP-N-acetylglucosamine diphosphorylase/glucosamine-1-phosphate N-acetyltransferase GlmU [Hoeflea sp.]MBU4529553.1 bifunctional UDP-N-acetylglucosamine diphosphorylase/glucosamine-1-phosphate N-acetyltransferase GlmU [Alphaproteobacteria bacterium]MBU4546672.1 bifunctional UDP-N-acetylglucosamine diphosphorylase/glucosamine-1-phosphate N-acetyltransferase GlmU [Alphaproteobacteria bacterium]MBU4550940.1 bifunctional UDP-N-acetylglucosamine diphosphorylase/glucosamine-1-phosphate 
MARTCLAVVLAAGDATRMKSSKSKVLHTVGNLPLIAHVTRAAASAGVRKVGLVVGRDASRVIEAAESGIDVPVASVEQTERKGTGHAVLMARDIIGEGFDDVVVLYGDGPLINPESLLAATAERASGADVVVLGFRAADPTGYGRLIERDGELIAIREHREASDEELAIDFCNGGVITFSGREAVSLLEAIGNENAKGEYYLTDIVEIARARGLRCVAIEAPEEDMMGCNTRAELAEIEAVWQARARHAAMLSGVTMIDPASVFLSFDTELGPDVMIEPNVWFGPGVRVGAGAVIHAFSHLEGADVGPGAMIGPFARLRPGTELAEKAKVGNFCETKKAKVGAGAKINHLSYIGDAVVGEGANIGAGTITCNYDGQNKHVTDIGAGAFIGSNSSLVAPVRIGDGAYVGSGSVITMDVPDDALAIARARQETKPGRASRLREKIAAIKALTKKPRS